MNRKRNPDPGPSRPAQRRRVETDAEIQEERYQMQTGDPNAQFADTPQDLPFPPGFGPGLQAQPAEDNRPNRNNVRSEVVASDEARRRMQIQFDNCQLHDDEDRGEDKRVDLRHGIGTPSRRDSNSRAFEPGSSSEGGPGARTQPYFDRQIQSLPSSSNPLPPAEGFRGAYWRTRLKDSLKATGRKAVSQEMTEQADSEEMERLMRDLRIYVTSHRQDKSVLPMKPKGIRTKFPRLLNQKVYANHFVIRYQPTPYFLYTVTWRDPANEHRRFPKIVKQALWKILIRDGEGKFKSKTQNLVYEGGSLLISPTKFNWLQDTEKFILGPSPADNQPIESTFKRVEATIKFEKAVQTNELDAFLCSSTKDDPLEFPKNLVQVGNSIMKQYCRQDIHEHGPYFESGRFFYVSDNPAPERNVQLSALLEGKTGYFQSVRLLQAGLTLNVDVMTTPFYRVMKLSDAWRQMIEMGSLLPQEKRDLFRHFIARQDTSFDQDMVDVVNRYWGNLTITSTHRQTMWTTEAVKLYSIFKVRAERAEAKIVPDFENNTNTSLLDLMVQKYRLEPASLQGVLPVIQVHKHKPHFLPWGSCYTHSGARFPYKLEDNAQRKLQRTVGQRYKSILQWIQYRYTRDTGRNPKTEEAYRLNVQFRDMLEVTTISLADPKLTPSNRNEFAKPANIDQLWGVLSFVRPHKRNLMDSFITALGNRARDRRMGWSREVVLEEVEVDERESLSHKKERVLKHIKNLIAKVERYSRVQPAPRLKLILCFMERRMYPEYATLKYTLDHTEGVPSQVIVLPASENMISKRVSNLLLKINVKCGGSNFELSRESRHQMPLLGHRTILMGADVTHPGAGEGGPSIAAVVATTDGSAVNYATRLRAQEGREERLVGLQKMVEELLKVYKGNEGVYPDNILFFRDGVSEQFIGTTLRFEGTAILRAAEALDENRAYRPKVAIILAVKRHHTRFFVLPNRRADERRRSDERRPPPQPDNPTNLPKGSVVADGVTHPVEYDFFLASHECRIGTCRPTHYHVLLDQIDMQPDDLYTLVYNLCWTFQRSSASVSLVTPVYYAHLAAFRAKIYVEYLSATTNDFGEIDAHDNLRNRLWYL